MPKRKRTHSTDFKAKVALAALKAELTLAQITSQYAVHTTQVRQWKAVALEAMKEGFSKKRVRDKADQEELIAGLYEHIGRLQTELNWLKKKWS